MALKNDGSLWTWGWNYDGQLGDGSTTASAVPKLIGTGYTAIAAGTRHNLALKTDGSLWAWGSNRQGQLGDGSSIDSLLPMQIDSGFIAIAAGRDYSVALKNDGSVWAWGSNWYGQLGDGTLAQRRTAALVVNDGGNGPLDLIPSLPKNIPANKIPPFFSQVSSDSSIVGATATVRHTTRFNAADIGKSGAVFVTAMMPPSSLDAAQIINSRDRNFNAGSAATDASAFVLTQLTPSGWQLIVNGQLIPYASGILGDLLATQKILDGIDTANLKGAEFCVGYGASAAEMTTAGRMRAVATIPDPSATAATSAGCNVTWSGLAATDNVTGLWWNPAESGWGVNFNQQGGVLFGTLFTYDLSGRPLWLVMSNGARQTDGSTFTGDLYQTTGPAFNANPFTPIGAANIVKVGTMSAAFLSRSAATLSYTVNGVSVTKLIQPQVFGSRAALCQSSPASRATLTNYQDLWWKADESGWGVNVTHQDNTLFATLFTYDANGTEMWLVMSAGVKQTDGAFLGDLYQTTGPAFNALPFAPIGAANVTKVGSMQLRFSNGVNGTLNYTVNGVAVSKAITRQEFSTPLPACSS